MTLSVKQNTTYLQNGVSQDVQKVSNNLQGTAISGNGISIPPFFLYNVVPFTTTTGFVSPAATIIAGAPVTFTAANTVIFNGIPAVQLDCLRVPTFTTGGAGGLSTVATTVTVTGYDNNYIPVTSQKTFADGAIAPATTYVVGSKSFYLITSVTFSALPGAAGQGVNTVSVDNGSALGLPYFVPNAQYIYYMAWNGALLNPFNNAAFIPGYQFNPLTGAGSLGLPTATSIDARGIVIPASVPDGTKMLTVMGYQYGADSYLQAMLANNVLSAQIQTQILATTVNEGQLLKYDEIGLQFPGDILAANKIINAAV